MAVLKYSLLRLGVFSLAFVAAYFALPLDVLPRMVVGIIVGLIVSGAVGYLFFNSWRLAAGEQLAGRLGRRRRSTAEAQDNAAEDELAEEFHSGEVSAERNRRQAPD